MNEFQNLIGSEIQSLGFMAISLDLLIIIGLVCVTRILGTNNIMRRILPSVNLIISVLGVSLIIISFYSVEHTSYTELPV